MSFINAARSIASDPIVSGTVASIAAGLEQRIKNSFDRHASRKRAADRFPADISYLRFGDEPGSSDSKRQATVTDTYQAKSTCTLDVQNVTNIAKDGAGADAINTRERDVAVIKGFKVCSEIKNINTSDQMYYNIAVVVARDNLGVPTDDFFRAESGTSRTVNFDPSILTANELHCLPINTDKYIILKHKRIKLLIDNVTSVGRNQTNHDFYMPINRQLRWDDALGTPRQDIYILSWASFYGRTFGTTAASGQNDTSENYERSLKVVTYFDDPSNYKGPRRRSTRKRKYRKYKK